MEVLKSVHACEAELGVVPSYRSQWKGEVSSSMGDELSKVLLTVRLSLIPRWQGWGGGSCILRQGGRTLVTCDSR